MKREGRQHGVVQSYLIFPPPAESHQRHVKTIDSAYVTGIFAKVSKKPTNQSKFTGKFDHPCGACRVHPVSKSKVKAKGTMKLRSIGSDPRLIGFPSGVSATGVLAQLANDKSHDDGDEYDGATDDDYDYDNDNCNVELGIEVASIVTEEQIGGENGIEDEIMSYCDVGLYWEVPDEFVDDGWYLVGNFI